VDFDVSLIERLFRAELLRVLLGKDLISQDIVDNLLSWRHSGFSVHGDVKAHDRDADPTCARPSPLNALRRPGLRFCHLIRPNTPFPCSGFLLAAAFAWFQAASISLKCSPS